MDRGNQRRRNQRESRVQPRPSRWTRATGWILDRLAAPPARPGVYLEGCRAWGGALVIEAIEDGVPCPVCRGLPLRRSWYCLWCDRCGQDGLVDYPGEPIGSRMRPCPTRYIPPADGLVGGVGRRRR